MKKILRRIVSVAVLAYFRRKGQVRTAILVSERSRLFPFFRWLYGFEPMLTSTEMTIFGYTK